MPDVDKWLEVFTLEEILERNDITPEDAVIALWKAGLIKEDWTEDYEWEQGEEED